MKGYQSGNALLVILIVIALGGGGYYLYSSGKLGLSKNTVPDSTQNYVLPTAKPIPENSVSETPRALSTSSEMSLTLTAPLNGVVLKTGSVVVRGKTSPNAEVFVNDQSTRADANGNFSLTVNLDEGENKLVVSANDAEVNVVEQSLSVNVQTF